MSRKTKEDAEKTRARIIASALALFVKNGYERTTFTDIAARLKMTKGAVYWHFPTKDALLVALVEEMLEKFRRQLNELSPERELTFLSVADVMVAHAERIVEDPKGAAFFLLMQTQVKWGAESMAKVRERLLSQSSEGPYHFFIRAIERDKATGLVRPDVNAVAVASVSISIWIGLVRSKIEKFLECNLRETLERSYQAMWESMIRQ